MAVIGRSYPDRRRRAPRSRRRWLLVPVLAAVLAGGAVEMAAACSCVAGGSARDGLQTADAAFVGVVTARRVQPPGPDGIISSADPVELDFRVERAFKGQLGEQVTVHTVSSGASCGLEARPGDRLGLFLQRDDTGRLHSGLCSTVDPAELAQAAEPLPRPSGRGPVRFLLRGAFGEPSVIALDARGRTLAYGGGRDSIGDLDVCPGGRRSLETTFVGRRPQLGVRNLRSMLVRRRANLFGDVLDVSCRTGDARKIVALVSQYRGGKRHSRLLELSGSRTRVLHRGSADEGSIAGRYAWLASGVRTRSVTRVDLVTGRAQNIARLAAVHALVASPGGQRAAFQSSAGRLCVADGRGPLIRRAGFGLLAWVDDATLVARAFDRRPIPVRVLDRRLRSVRGLRGLDRALLATGARGRLYAIAGDRLVSVAARQGARRVLGRVPAGASDLAAVGGATFVTARARQAFVRPGAR